MSKKRIRRYTLVQSEGIEVRELPSLEAAEELKELINKYNGKLTNPYFCGNIEIEQTKRGVVLTFTKYKKIAEPQTLEEIDKVTLTMSSSTPIRQMYNLTNKRPIEIALRQNGNVTTLPVFYSNAQKYFEPSELREMFITRCLSKDFIYTIYNDEYLNNTRKPSLYDALDYLMAAREKVKCGFPPDTIVSPAYDTYRAIIRKKDGTPDYRSRRYLIQKLKELDDIEELEKSRLESLEQEEYHQLTLFEYMAHKTTK